MIEIICKDNKLLVKGSFEFGFVGTYENKDFEGFGRDINFNYNLDEILEDIKKQGESSNYYTILKDYIVNDKIDVDIIIKVLTEYYNLKEKQIKKYEKQINDKILFDLFINFYALEYPFWEIEKMCIQEELEKIFIKNKNCKFDFESFQNCKECELYSSCISDIVYINGKVLEEWEEQFRINDKIVVISDKNIDIEANLRKIFPMVNFNFLLNCAKPECITLYGKYITFNFRYDYILDYEDWSGCCSHYVRLDEDLSFSPIECYFDD